MTTHIAEMSKLELQVLIEETVEQKLIELFGDPDEGMVLTHEMRKRLLHQRDMVMKGDRGTPMEEAIIHLGLE